MQAALLPDRGVVKVVGDDARRFLNGLVTGDMAKVAAGNPRFTALLTPQGKIIVDFIIAEASAEDGGGFFLDCPRALAPALVEKLNFYKLRAKVICEDLSEVLGVMAVWNGTADSEYGLSYQDPRLPALGSRIMLPPHLAGVAAADIGADLTEADDYETHRIALGVPRGGLDFVYGACRSWPVRGRSARWDPLLKAGASRSCASIVSGMPWKRKQPWKRVASLSVR
jgi:folate-binding Fe-S cluster repair protein YgfZ